MMGSLATVAIMSPSEQFLNMSGMLGVGLGCLLGVSVAAMFFPQSRALYNIWLWGGLALFGGFTLYDVQKVLHKAKMQP